MHIFTPKAVYLAATFSLLVSSGSFAALAAENAPSPAKDSPTKNTQDSTALVATVNGQPIYRSQVDKILSTLTPQLKNRTSSPASTEQLKHLIADQLIKHQIILQEAIKAGIDKDPTIQDQIKRAGDNILENAYLSKIITPKLTDKAINDYYKAHFANKKPEEEIHARHILVDTESTAKEIITKLKKGGDFVKLAKEYSKDKGTTQNGGDLGWFKKDTMIPAFSDAAFSMKDNSISKTPVQTPYGWHVIEVLGHRSSPIPTLDSVKDQIRQSLIQQYVQDIMDKANKDSSVVLYDDNGKPIPTSAKASSSAPATVPDSKH
ncbi:peptidylprolyl isomerase [Entomobacter blattae]|uniref:Parvulin-like PPIase n=1 Tax=Entomobacter blattae TaxID=2762277 RepID=A0A7H1NTE7_9PROT|nr:peptidylprolyl isomerase [Entomobacter blattae]QNT79057.1 Foldase protein PrsA [Entomobacter blattae]